MFFERGFMVMSNHRPGILRAFQIAQSSDLIPNTPVHEPRVKASLDYRQRRSKVIRPHAIATVLLYYFSRRVGDDPALVSSTVPNRFSTSVTDTEITRRLDCGIFMTQEKATSRMFSQEWVRWALESNPAAVQKKILQRYLPFPVASGSRVQKWGVFLVKISTVGTMDM
ncbi:MAG: hypothetical protein Q9171_002175 [Xanthocarpia ochracea]